jgi:HEAT repeat protein
VIFLLTKTKPVEAKKEESRGCKRLLFFVFRAAWIRVIVILLFFLFLETALGAQDSILHSYQRNFMRASLSTKVGVLLDAATDERASEFIGQLYGDALIFSLQNAEILRGEADLNNLTVIAARGAGNSGHTQSIDTLWKIFTGFRDSQARIAALDALAILGKGNSWVTENLNQFLANQNSLYRSGMDVDIPTLSTCINALGALAEESSFPVLFAALTSGYPEPVMAQAVLALENLPVDFPGKLTEILRKNPPMEKLAVFRAVISSSRMNDEEKGAFAQTALEIGMEESFSADYESALTTLCTLAIRALADLKWAGADTAVLQYFYRVQGEYQENKINRERDRLLEVITCLSVLNSPDAAQALSLELGYLNSQFERTKKDGTFGENDEALVLGIIRALGEARDKIAFDNLHYVAYLDYPENIKAAAREALNNLKW